MCVTWNRSDLASQTNISSKKRSRGGKQTYEESADHMFEADSQSFSINQISVGLHTKNIKHFINNNDFNNLANRCCVPHVKLNIRSRQSTKSKELFTLTRQSPAPNLLRSAHSAAATSHIFSCFCCFFGSPWFKIDTWRQFGIAIILNILISWWIIRNNCCDGSSCLVIKEIWFKVCLRWVVFNILIYGSHFAGLFTRQIISTCNKLWAETINNVSSIRLINVNFAFRLKYIHVNLSSHNKLQITSNEIKKKSRHERLFWVPLTIVFRENLSFNSCNFIYFSWIVFLMNSCRQSLLCNTLFRRGIFKFLKRGNQVSKNSNLNKKKTTFHR